MARRDRTSRRDKILAVALELFNAQGYEATTIRQIAESLGITSAALYYHFPSKLAVLEALVVPYLDEVGALLERFPPASTTTAEAKRRLLAGYAGIVMGAPQVSDLVGREPELDAHPELGPRMKRLVADMTKRLAAPANDDLARLRAAAAIGALRRPVLRSGIDAEPHLEELLEAAMAALGA